MKLLTDSGHIVPPPHEIKMRWVNDVLMAWCDHGWVAKVRPWKAPHAVSILSPGTDNHDDLVICYRYVFSHEVPAHIKRAAQINELLPALPDDVPPYEPPIIEALLRPWLKYLLTLRWN